MESIERARQLSALLADRQINHDTDERGLTVAMFGGDNFDNVKAVIEFSGNADTEFATILLLGIARAPGSLVELASPLVATFNREYRWGRWSIDDEHHDIMMDQNIYMPKDADGSELVFLHLMSMLTVIDDAYPKLMRKIYG